METSPQERKEDLLNFFHDFRKPGLGQVECIKKYDDEKTVNLYHQASVEMGYRGPRYTADMLSAVIDNKEDVLILDVAAGSGMVGEELHRHGFRQIHAHDGAMAMLDKCRESGFYSKFICAFLKEGSHMPILDNTYDAVTCSGGTVENHLPPAMQAEFIRIIKPGGFFVNAYNGDIVPTIKYGAAWREEARRLEDENKWVFYGRLTFPRYGDKFTGIVDIYQVI